MKIIRNFLIIVFICSVIPSCFDMDIPPPNLITEAELFSSEAGMDVYLARIYTQMPFEEFRYHIHGGFWDHWLVTPGTTEGASLGRDARAAMTAEAVGRSNQSGGAYWERAFNALRDINRLIENLPDFSENFSVDLYNHYLGEAYFTRAYIYYALAKRYGGVPLVLEVLKYPEIPMEELEIPRSTEEATWDQVLVDFNRAIELLGETSPKRGYSNKFVALGFKSEAMLFAGSVAKYHDRNMPAFGEKTGVRVVGFDPATADATSRRYFREAYNAAREVMRSERYELYRNRWAAGDKEAQYNNMMQVFRDLNSRENIYIVEYQYPYKTHSFDAYNIPRQHMGPNGYSSGNNPTLDFIELFDGFDKNPDGTIKVFDNDGKYLLFDHPMDFFRNAEPRLRAYVIFPGDMFKGEEIEIRRGVYTGDVTGGIDPLMTINGVVNYGNRATRYPAVDAVTGAGKYGGTEDVLRLGHNPTTDQQTANLITLPDGRRMTAGGINGPFTDENTAAVTGFYIRKWLNPDVPQSRVREQEMDQHWIMLRYAQILLDVAEAACELAMAGETAPAGDDFVLIATQAIEDIRDRAGADPLVGQLTLNNEGLQIIRRERRKELAFENKVQWDIRRWRTQHSDPLNGSTQENGAYYRGLYPFFSTQANKWFFDARFEESLQREYRLRPIEYHFAIPSGEVSRSPVIDQQPGR